MVWLEIIALNVAVFFLQVAFPSITSTFAFVPANLMTAPWTMLTSMFLHGSPIHLFFNMWALFIFGPILERAIGSKKFIVLYLLAGLVGNLGFLIFYPSTTAGIGASGAIYGILGALAVIMPNLMILVFFLPMPMWMAAIAWAVIEFLSSFTPSSIANLVHLTGLAVGIIWGLKLRNEVSSSWERYQ